MKPGTDKPGCLVCLRGGSCIGAIKKDGIRTLFGWSKCPAALNLTFEPCVFGAACNGAPNKALLNKYKYVDDTAADTNNNIDPAAIDRNASCSTGYKNNSLLCAACDNGYSHSGLGDTCDKCPSESANVAIGVVGILVGILGLFIFVQMTLSDEGKIDPKDGAKSIGLSFIQITSLLSTFPIAWPSLFVALFRIGGAVAVMGQHLVNFKCLYPTLSEAQVFYMARIVGAIMPIIVSGCCLLLWLAAHQYYGGGGGGSGDGGGSGGGVARLWPKIKTSVVALLFLMWPGLCSETFALFSCRTVCGELLLRVDLDEKCWDPRHSSYAFLLGLPMLFAYVLGLPVVAFVNVWITQNRAFTRGAKIETLKGHLTWGLFYSSYRTNVWWWESTVALRKITIAFLGVFGASMGEMQVHLTAWGMVCVLLLTAFVQPFGERVLLQYLEMGTLFATWMTLWAGTVFNAYPRCEGAEEWCNALSVLIGLLNIFIMVAVIVVIVYYTKQKQCIACCEKIKDKTIGTRRRKKMARQQVELRSRFESAEVSSFVNPNLEQEVVEGTQELSIELTEVGGGEGEDEIWQRYLDESSHQYYAYNSTTGETKWEEEDEEA